MDFLKALFGAEAKTFEQFVAAVAAQGMKLVDLTKGGYISKEKYDAEVNKLTTANTLLTTQLTDASKTIDGFKELDVEGIKLEVENWKGKAELAEAKADAAAYQSKIEGLVSSENFSSKAAKRSFVADLIAKKLPVQDGKILGYEDFKKVYSETDPTVFTKDGKPYRMDALGGGGVPTVTKEDFKKLTISEKITLKTENPELYKTLRG